MFDILAIDWGHKRYGLSYGDSSSHISIPDQEERLTTNILNDLETILQSKPIQKIVVGIPTNFHLQKTIVTTQVERFVDELQKKFPDQDIVTINERGTSKESREHGVSSKHSINHLSAAKILERYFAKDSNSNKN